MATDGGTVQDRGQGPIVDGPAPDNGQRTIVHPANLGKVAVPASRPNADISTERKS